MVASSWCYCECSCGAGEFQSAVAGCVCECEYEGGIGICAECGVDFFDHHLSPAAYPCDCG